MGPERVEEHHQRPCSKCLLLGNQGVQECKNRLEEPKHPQGRSCKIRCQYRTSESSRQGPSPSSKGSQADGILLRLPSMDRREEPQPRAQVSSRRQEKENQKTKLKRYEMIFWQAF